MCFTITKILLLKGYMMKLIIPMGLALLAMSPLFGMADDLLKADPKAVDADGNSVLYRELLKARPDHDVVQCHLSKGAEASRPNAQRQTALHILLSRGVSPDNLWLMSRVLRSGHRPDEKALEIAHRNGDEAAIELMQAEPALLAAIKGCDAQRALALVKKGGYNENARWENGDTFLHLCAREGKDFAPVVEALVWQGADPKLLNDRQDNVLHTVLRNPRSYENSSAIHLMLFFRVPIDDKAIALATVNDHGLLLRRAKARTKPEEALFESINCCDERTALFILDEGRVNLKACSHNNDTYGNHSKGDTFLHRCAWAGADCADVIEALLKRGADPKAINSAGESALDKAISHERCFDRGQANERKESYFIEWLRLRLQHPTGPLSFVVEYDDYNQATGQREKGKKRVDYYSPKMKPGATTHIAKGESKLA